MDRKSIWLCLAVGSFAGGYVPALWGASTFSPSAILFSALGGFFGIWVGYRISQ